MSDHDEFADYEGWVPGDPEPPRRRSRPEPAPPPSAYAADAPPPPPPPPPGSFGAMSPPPRAAVGGSGPPPPDLSSYGPGTRSRRVPGGVVLGVLVSLVATIGIMGWVFTAANEAMDSFAVDTPESIGAAPTPVPTIDLLRVDPAPGLAALGMASGSPERALQVVLYDEYVVAEVEDVGGAPGAGVRWVIYPARLTRGPEPVRKSAEDLAPRWFALDEVDWSLIPALGARGVAEVEASGTAGGEVSHVIVDRFLPFDEAVNIRVYVTSPTGSAYVRFSPAGELIEVVG